MKCGKNKIVLHSISYSYRRKDNFEIKDLTLSIPEKSISAVIGKNGSGKTTLLLLILGYLRPKYGQISVYTNGEYIPIQKVNGRIAYLPQNENIPKEYSVDSFLLMGRTPFIGFFSQPTNRDYSIIEDIKLKLDLMHLGKERLGQISGGELQRVRIGRALAQEAEIILFDEPITHMDIEIKRKIITLMGELRKIGKTIIFTTHDPSEAFQIADNSILISKKQKILSGPTFEILNQRNLSHFLGTLLEIKEVDGNTVLLVKDK